MLLAGRRHHHLELADEMVELGSVDRISGGEKQALHP